MGESVYVSRMRCKDALKIRPTPNQGPGGGLQTRAFELVNDIIGGGFKARGAGLAALELIGGEELHVRPPALAVRSGDTHSGGHDREERKRNKRPHDPV